MLVNISNKPSDLSDILLDAFKLRSSPHELRDFKDLNKTERMFFLMHYRYAAEEKLNGPSALMKMVDNDLRLFSELDGQSLSEFERKTNEVRGMAAMSVLRHAMPCN